MRMSPCFLVSVIGALNALPRMEIRMQAMNGAVHANGPYSLLPELLRRRALPATCTGSRRIPCHSRMAVTTPEPTVRPPSRMAKRRPVSIAIGAISSAVNFRLSPGITISVPSGSVTVPVTSVVRK